MPTARIWILAILLWSPLGALAGESDIKVVRTVFTNMPPYIFEKDGRAEGPFLSLLQEAAQGLPIAPEPDFVPLARMMRMAAEKRLIILSLARTPSREQAGLVWIDEIIGDEFVFATLAGRHSVDSFEEAGKLPRLSVLNGGAASEMLAEMGFTNVTRANDMRSEAALLRAGRTDAWFEPAQMIRGAWGQLGFPPEQLQLGKSQKALSLWMCATKSVEPEIIEALRERIGQLRKSGRLAELLHQS